MSLPPLPSPSIGLPGSGVAARQGSTDAKPFGVGYRDFMDGFLGGKGRSS